MASVEGKKGSTISTSIDTRAIIRKWETAALTAQRLFRNLDNHREKVRHKGFHTFRLDKADDGTGLLAAICTECGDEIDRSRKILSHQAESLTRAIWNQMVHEAKIELKARLKAEHRE